ncbi:putative late blight resistance protein homolog R1B-8 isoform X2 [Salvia hispanica]|uniref:putative late blight resistance protein homolog R1B-8 isoform X2 n=2 Tax=Salvia hispanica TaxID=49212 RepID=UPI002009D463|nr:putative late blight resistance protein homolog R1B-8 isoform X2 [Salvia hispanica]
MAAYGALVSLLNIIDTIDKHPSPPISIHKEQVESLTQNVTFLLEFLDGYISPVVADGCEADPLERRIADAVYAAEDVIESQILLQIHNRSTFVENHDFYDDLQKVIEEMNLIEKEVKTITDEALLQQKPTGELTSSSTVKEHVMVGFEEVFLEVLDKLTGDRLHRQIIPITGMGGIGLLAKSECTRECWERMEQNLNSIVINNNDEFCLKVLRMSYLYLPNYLKPCFLYMGVFEEDRRIRVSMLEKLWVSEGFLKPQSGKCLETIAQEYLKELVDRNLILIDKLGSIGKIKYCKVHDLLRDLCLKEAEKEMYYHVLRDDPLRINSARRVVLKTRGSIMSEVFRSLSHARSLICDFQEGDGDVRLPHNLGLLRTFKAYDDNSNSWNSVHYLDNVFELVNSRYLAVRIHDESKFPSSIDLLWNLHTLIIYCSNVLIVPTEIWKLHQLRHLVFEEGEVILTCPPSSDNDIVILENLETLKGVQNLFLNEEVVKRIHNVKKLHLNYYVNQMKGGNCLSHLQCLSRLENLRCEIENICNEYLQRIMFPHSLKKLCIVVSYDVELELEDMMLKIGSLPLLEKFVLKGGRFITRKWETVEGHFLSLKFLRLQSCDGLQDWIVADSSHFPLLQKVRLCYLGRLKEIPSEVGEIATLKSVLLDYCSESAVVSAKKIVEEQEDLYGDELDLHVRAIVYEKQKELKSLATTNFEVKVGMF